MVCGPLKGRSTLIDTQCLYSRGVGKTGLKRLAEDDNLKVERDYTSSFDAHNSPLREVLFVHEKVDGERGKGICPRVPSWKMVRPAFKIRQPEGPARWRSG